MDLGKKSLLGAFRTVRPCWGTPRGTLKKKAVRRNWVLREGEKGFWGKNGGTCPAGEWGRRCEDEKRGKVLDEEGEGLLVIQNDQSVQSSLAQRAQKTLRRTRKGRWASWNHAAD